MELIFHKSEKYISEDILYYTVDQRDKHSMIKPKRENLISMTVDSNDLSNPVKSKITNALYPFKKNSVDKIYIGLSFPLFSNNWAASYLRYLLKVLKKDGSIILPVYPEEQASEKGMWSRSFLENIFTSRTGWAGTNNVWAENDGVMSMRIGKKFPEKMNSTLNFYLEKIGNEYYRLDDELIDDKTDSLGLIKNIWSTSKFSSIVEKIIQDNCADKKIIYCDIGDNPSLPFEISVSNYLKIKETIITSDNNESYNELKNYFSYRCKSEYKKIDKNHIKNLKLLNPDIISVIYNKDNGRILNELLKNINNSAIIFYGVLDTHNSLLNKFDVLNYSSIVATRIDSKKTINHYSDIIEKEINDENDTKSNRIYVLIPK